MISTARPIVCYVTDRASLPVSPNGDRQQALLESVREAAAAGVTWIELREKDLDGRALLELTRGALAAVHEAARGPRDMTSTGGQPPFPRPFLLVNDRLDVAWAAGADGVHLGENSLPVAAVAEYRRESERSAIQFAVGASCHSLEGAQQAERDGADYIFFGPVFATPSKAPFGPPQGLAKLREVCRGTSLPVLAIGGISLDTAGQCREVGAAGIAAIGLFQQASRQGSTLAEVAANLRAKLFAE